VGSHVSENFHTGGAHWQTATWKPKKLGVSTSVGRVSTFRNTLRAGYEPKKPYVKPGRPGHKCIFDKLKPAGHRHRTSFSFQTSMHSRCGKG